MKTGRTIAVALLFIAVWVPIIWFGVVIFLQHPPG